MTPPPQDSLASDVSPRTQGLALFIEEAAAELRNRCTDSNDAASQSDGLLFLGNWHDAHPRLLFHDPVLEPVDKVVWAVIRHHAEPGKPTAFPSYPEIARCANVSSSATIARAIMILRITRWISLCDRVRDAQGRYRGNVYALHDEPATLADALHLDPEYLSFLHDMRKHHHGRVRRVATRVLDTLQEQIAEGKDLTRENLMIEQIERRLAAFQRGGSKGVQGSFYSVSTRQLQRLQQEETNRLQILRAQGEVQNLKAADENADQNLNADHKTNEKQQDSEIHQNLNTAPLCSSCCLYIKTTTTTKTARENLNTASTETLSDALCFPPQWRPDEISLARMYLPTVADEQRQDVLDELQGRLGHGANTSNPIRNPIGYLTGLCNAARGGTFQLTSFGLQVREARKRTAALARLAQQGETACNREALSNPHPANPLAQRVEAIRQRSKHRFAHARGVHGAPPSMRPGKDSLNTGNEPGGARCTP